ncbi:MAG: hypothetical protein HWN68_02825 [Desulfobacterales bacterium]|nr:hypothetical protein [Desulfobacterales bacterium]
MSTHRDTYSSHPYYDYEDEKKKVFGDAIILLISTLTFVEFRLIGRLFLSEIILLGLLPFLLFSKGWMLWEPLPKKLITLGILWLCAQVITDLIRATPFQDYIRGWAKITLFLAHFAALYMLLYGNKRRLILFALGLVFSEFLAYKFNIDRPFSHARSHPWKFGVGAPITLLLILISTTTFVSRMRLLPSFILFFLALLNLYMGFRSLAGVCFLAAVYTFTQQYFAAIVDVSVRLSLKKVAFISLLIIGAGVSFFKFYEYAAENYWLGERARRLVRLQSGSFGVLLGGRTGIYSATKAIMDSPLIGHGSWAKNPDYIDALRDLEKYGYTIRSLKTSYRSGLIPTHSYLLGGWVESGILGAVFWGWVLILTAKTFFYQYNIRDPLNPLVAYIGIGLVWSIMFSPFGATGRLATAFFLVLIMSVSQTSQTNGQHTLDDNPSVPSQ